MKFEKSAVFLLKAGYVSPPLQYSQTKLLVVFNTVSFMIVYSRPSKFTVAVVSSRSVFHPQTHRMDRFYIFNVGKISKKVKKYIPAITYFTDHEKNENQFPEDGKI